MNISAWPKEQARWYFGVRCKKCHSPILFALDRQQGAGAPPISAAKLVLTCELENCGYQADYTAAAVSRYQKQPAKPGKTARKDVDTKRRKHKH